MLTHYEVTSASDAKNYYGSSVSPGAASSRQGYYAEGQETAGKYGGKLAAGLGLDGKPVDQATFERLCDNLHPFEEDKPLTARTNDYRVVCYDFTFSAPKSFSIIEAFATPEERVRLRQAFDNAVADTVVCDMEPDMHCRVREGGADHNIVTGNVLTASFDHATARAKDVEALPDPHWHKHVLFWNATRRADGRIMAAQIAPIVRDKAFYRASFYARLADRLERDLGLAIDRRGGTEWEIAGVPQSAIDKFSKRTAQIEAEAKRLGIIDEAEKAGLGAKIRSKKMKDLTMPELRKVWDAQLTDDEREALASVYRREAEGGKEVTAAEAVAWSLEHLSEKLSVFPEREVQRVALLYGLGHVTPEQVAAELPRQGVITAEIDGRRESTTEGLQREEDYIVGRAMAGRGSVAPAGVAEGLDRKFDGEKKSLNDEQWDAVIGLLNSDCRINLVEGWAGTGKTELLQKYDEGMRRAGQTVTYLATTSPATEVLKKGKFDAHTVAHFLLDEKMQKAAKGGRVVVDEVSMLGHKDAVKLFQLAEKYDLKLIFGGDQMQHGSVPRGAFLRVLKEYGGVRPFKLTEILRQQSNPEYLAAVKLLAEGRTEEGFDAIDGMGRVVELADDTDRCRHIAADYVQALDDRKSVLVVSPTHAEARAITAAIRQELREAECLEGEDREFTRLVQVDASTPQRGLASTYRPGDVIQFHQNAKGGFTKGDRLTVTDPAKVPLSEAAKFALYRPENIALAAGDRIRFTGTVKTLDGKHVLKNGMTHAVAGITPGGNIRLDNSWVIGKEAGHFRYGYTETSFGSQGRTVHRIILGMSSHSTPAMNMEQLYVSASRAKEWIRIYTDDKDEVREAVKRSSQKLAALDLRPKRTETKPETGWRERLHKHMARRRKLSVIGRMRAAWDKVKTQAKKEKQKERQVDYGYGR
jgi:conjugative relaxase-like TrwC/TraI family protein